ncbi:hypothetical protein [Chitinophaga silvisoli]|uniref:Uncharacterized protein n=1 Tax=Chitinophaga silvisoli TaxID=2291814 RepID=A0A3E1P4L0_9BACT|nr:hypothetical protein [Chitinophaga silvisoli]RFM34938.1 hypothetical protein DXN04_11990 [Chitinophaga silvisoli]
MKADNEIAIIVLACKDYESLQLTLGALNHTVLNGEKVIIILNGDNALRSGITEYVARTWCAAQPQNRFVVKPLCAPAEPYFAIREVLETYPQLKDTRYICKIDDDIIPIKPNWLPELLAAYKAAAGRQRTGFVTGLINNNCWATEELITLYDKWEEYNQLHGYQTHTGWGGRRVTEAGRMDYQDFGTLWHYPYIARWVHQWTSLDLPRFIDITHPLPVKEIPLSVYYSIGCMLFEKEFWLSFVPEDFNSTTDEMIVFLKCRDEHYHKWAVMNQPMIHLFYTRHRLINQDLLDDINASLASHFQDPAMSGQLKALRQQFQPALQQQMATMQEDFVRMRERIDLLLNNVEIQ